MEINWEMVFVAGLVVLSFVLTWVLIKRKDIKDFIVKQVDEAEKWMIAHEAEIPSEFKGLFDDCMEAIKDLKNAMLDNKITYGEIIEIGKHVLAMVEELKNIFKK